MDSAQSSSITATCSIIVAIAAVAVSIFQSCQIQRHFRVSIDPHLEFNSYFSESSKYWGIGISNDGLGPAIIHDAQLCQDGEPLPSGNRNGWPYVTFLNGLQESRAVFKVFYKDDVILPEEDKLVFGYRPPFPEQAGGKRLAVRRIATRLDYLICYCSALNDCEQLVARYRAGIVRRQVDTCDHAPKTCLDDVIASTE